MIVTIDGPAGTGKSTVARKVAERLGFDFLDTGAMYRTIALEALRRNASLKDSRELAFVARHCRIAFDWKKRPPAVLLNDEPVSHLLRGYEVTSAASHVAAIPVIPCLCKASEEPVFPSRGAVEPIVVRDLSLLHEQWEYFEPHWAR